MFGVANDNFFYYCLFFYHFRQSCKLSQYADYTTLILDGSDNSVRQSFSLLDSFATISGLRINYEWTEALWIGSLRLQRRVY